MICNLASLMQTVMFFSVIEDCSKIIQPNAKKLGKLANIPVYNGICLVIKYLHTTICLIHTPHKAITITTLAS